MYIIIKGKSAMRRVSPSQILYFKVNSRTVTMHYNNEVFEFYSSMQDLEEMMDDKGFIRCHKAYLVAENKISGLNVLDNGWQLILENGECLPVSRTYHEKIKELFPKSKESSIFIYNEKN